MKKFEGILLATDLDGTLLKNDKTLSQENKEAIEYFKKEGGLFTFVTGRTPEGVKLVLDMIKPDVPIGCVNGGAVYDSKKQEFLWTKPLSSDFYELVDYVDKNFPTVGIEVNLFDKIYCYKNNHATEKHRSDESLEYHTCHYKDITEPIAKILFADTPESIDKLSKVLLNSSFVSDYDFIRSDAIYFEILPKDVSKGNFIKKITEILGIDNKKVIAVGDNDNDASMLSCAGVGFAVENASKKAKESADYITVSNEDHAIKTIIDLIDNKEIV